MITNDARCLLGVVLVCSVMGVLLCAPAGGADEADVLFPCIAWQKNLDQLRSGSGKLTWTRVHKLRQRESVVHHEFSFDGLKKRWDRTFEKYVIRGKERSVVPRIDADDGSRSYDYRKGGRRVYARETGRRDGARWNGEMLDYKYLMAPLTMELDEFRKALESSANVSLSRDGETGAFHLTLTPLGSRDTILVVFDPALGYAPTSEVHYDKSGNVVRRVTRDFVLGEGNVWYVTKMTVQGYDRKSGQGELAYSDEIIVHSFSPNAEIRAVQFEPKGFGTPPGVKVTDRVLGDLTYSLDVDPDEVQKTLDGLIPEITAVTQERSESSQIKSADAEPELFGAERGVEERSDTRALATSGGRQLGWRTITIAISICLLLGVCWFLRRQLLRRAAERR